MYVCVLNKHTYIVAFLRALHVWCFIFTPCLLGHLCNAIFRHYLYIYIYIYIYTHTHTLIHIYKDTRRHAEFGNPIQKGLTSSHTCSFFIYFSYKQTDCADLICEIHSQRSTHNTQIVDRKRSTFIHKDQHIIHRLWTASAAQRAMRDLWPWGWHTQLVSLR